jgi:3-hydroxymyristoyl/3-hydroxydecanoyl-(acyl carrier protein) dehydratase
MNEPIVIGQNLIENQVELELEIPESVIYFSGHFLKHPLLPGVVQIHWAELFARQYFPEIGQFSRLENIKFHSIIRPNSVIKLSLSYQLEKRKIVFNYFIEEQKYSSGRILLDR